MNDIRYDAAFVFGMIESQYHLRKMPVSRTDVEWNGKEDEYVDRCINLLIDEGILEEHSGVLKPTGEIKDMFTDD